MKTRGALLFYATRLYAKLRRKLQPQKQRRQKAALLVLAGIAVAEVILLSFRACCGDGSCALTYVCMGPTAAPPPPDALPGAAHVWLVAIDVAALLLKLLMPLQLLRLHRHRAAVADFLHNNPLARGADGRADGAATPRHNRRQPTLPDELSKLLRQRARPDRIADLEGSFLRVAKGANVEVVDAQSGRRAPRFLRVDDEFQQLRWSWNIDHVLLIDEIAEVEWHGGARCTVHYHATHSSLEHQTLAWTLAFAKQHEAATWVSVLRLLMRVDAARHGLDLQQRTRLKTAFKRAAKASNTLTVNQQYQFFEHLNLDLRQAHAGAQLSRVQLDRARALVRTEGKARERTILKSPEQMLANMRSPEGVMHLGRETRGDGGAGGSDKAGSDKALGPEDALQLPERANWFFMLKLYAVLTIQDMVQVTWVTPHISLPPSPPLHLSPHIPHAVQEIFASLHTEKRVPQSRLRPPGGGLPYRFDVDEPVEANWRGGGAWYGGRVGHRNKDGTYTIVYHSADASWEGDSELAHRALPHFWREVQLGEAPRRRRRGGGAGGGGGFGRGRGRRAVGSPLRARVGRGGAAAALGPPAALFVARQLGLGPRGAGGDPRHEPSPVRVLDQLVAQHVPRGQPGDLRLFGGDVQAGAADGLPLHRARLLRRPRRPRDLPQEHADHPHPAPRRAAGAIRPLHLHHRHHGPPHHPLPSRRRSTSTPSRRPPTRSSSRSRCTAPWMASARSPTGASRSSATSC